jgi:Ca2+-binding RTX toxin-like protein
VDEHGGPWDVWVVGVDGSGETRLTADPADDVLPVWSPDGERIAFATARDGNWELYDVALDGSGTRRLTRNGAPDSPHDSAVSWLDAGPGGRGCTITGTAGPDVIPGTAARDTICGLGGDDLLLGGASRDELRGGAGDDRLVSRGDAASDVVDGGPGRDRAVADRRDVLMRIEH